MSDNIMELIKFFVAVAGFAIAFITLESNKKKDAESSGQNLGLILTELGYIKSMLSEVKDTLKHHEDTIVDFEGRLSALESTVATLKDRLK